MQKRVEEKRRFLRLNVPITIEYILPDSNKIFATVTKDISALGLRFTTQDNLREGLILEITLKLPNTQNPVHATGRIVWIKRMGLEDNATSDIGVEFTKIEEDNKNTFLKYLCDLIYG